MSGALSDRAAVVLAVAVAAGSALPCDLPVAVGAVGVAVALAARRPALLCLSAALLASALSALAHAGLDAPAPARLDGRATLVTDPQWRFGGVEAHLRYGGRRFAARATGQPAAALSPLLAGEVVEVRGTARALAPQARARLRARHISASVELTSVRRVSTGSVTARVANGLRRLLDRGARSLPPHRQALLRGVVLGDDRDQDPAEIEDFRASGLTHLLAVSGQNVAFAVALAGPLLRRLGLRTRFVAALAVIGLFGVATRWEPSVLRASAMAAVALLASTLGRPVSAMRVLALAVAGLLLVDPLLVHSLGFRLSVAACAGIAVLGPPLRRRLPEPLAVTIAAQAGVLPLLIATFGPVPLATVPANVLAGPAAGPLMIWGLAAGTVAGVAGEPLATVVHLPTRALLAWLAGVARAGASLPLGRVDAGTAFVLAVAVAAALRLRAPHPRAVAAAVATATVVATVAGAAGQPALDGRPIAGARVWSRDGVVLAAAADPDGAAVVRGLRAAGVRRVDVLVVTRAGRRTAARLEPLTSRIPVRALLAPPAVALPAATAIAPGTAFTIGPFAVEVKGSRDRLEVRVGSARAPRARSP